MKRHNYLTALLIAACVACGLPALAQTQTPDVETLEAAIEAHEKTIQEKQQALQSVEEQIKQLEDQIKDLKSQRKQLQNEIKEQTKQRQQKFATRDAQVYDEEVVDVLYAPYNKAAVDEALANFEGMETKSVLKNKKLVENYGEYTKNLRDFIEEQKKVLAAAHWAPQKAESEIYKNFEKKLSKTKYWKIYDKKEKNESIDYLDRVMDKLMQFKNSGLNNETRYNEILNMLYAE